MLTRLDISAYKRIYDKNPMAVAVVTLLKNKDGEVNDFVYEYTNQAMANIDGIKVSDIIGKKYCFFPKKKKKIHLHFFAFWCKIIPLIYSGCIGCFADLIGVLVKLTYIFSQI